MRTVRQPGAHHGAVVLWRVAEPLRLSHTRTGVEANGDMYGAARLTVYACGRGVFRLTLIAKEARRVEVRRDGRRVNVVRFKTSDETWSVEIPAPADANGRGACTLELRPDAFLGSTRFEFVRSD